MRLRHFIPLAAHVVPTAAIGFGAVIPASCIAGINELTVGFALAIAGFVPSYVAGLKLIEAEREGRTVMRKPAFIQRQGRSPSGLLGHVVARVMAWETAADNARAVELLDLLPGDRVLDVGTGHGRTLGLLAARLPAGVAAGIDTSPVMLGLARRRNAGPIAAGRVEVRHGTSDDIPFPDESFTKALSVHTVYFWDPALPHLNEIRRVLEPGGRLVLGFRPAEDARFAAQYGGGLYRIRRRDEVEALLAEAGFELLDGTSCGCKRAMTYLLARKPGQQNTEKS
jgi:SAM-dependent methyltransferase